MSHTNSGACEKCFEILNHYPHVYPLLLSWFLSLQQRASDLHVSCAGRGRVDQEAAFLRGASRAHYGASAHNYNCALDLFQLVENRPVWNPLYFEEIVGQNLEDSLNWYGRSGAPFYELPHVEVTKWRSLIMDGLIHLVEL